MTMQAGGGVGYDFSTLRPAGSRAGRTGNVASGPVSFMKIWDAACAILLSSGARRGAMMATIRTSRPSSRPSTAVRSLRTSIARCWYNLWTQPDHGFDPV